MAMPIPTEEDVLGWMTALSNWGRWGTEDELGTLKLGCVPPFTYTMPQRFQGLSLENRQCRGRGT
jgi:hypothetical protein